MNSKLLSVLLVVSMFLSFALVTRAEEKATEEDIVLALSSQSSIKLFPKDPFKPMLVKKLITYVKPVPQIETKKIIKNETPVIKPLKLKVTGICGNSAKRQAVIQFDSREYLVDEGQVVLNKFKVVKIKNDKLVVFSLKEDRRRTFAL